MYAALQKAASRRRHRCLPTDVCYHAIQVAPAAAGEPSAVEYSLLLQSDSETARGLVLEMQQRLLQLPLE